MSEDFEYSDSQFSSICSNLGGVSVSKAYVVIGTMKAPISLGLRCNGSQTCRV